MASVNTYTVNPAWRLLLRDLGLQPADILRRAGLPDDLLGRAQAALSTDEYFRLWRGLEEESADPTLPLRIGAAISVEAFDPPIFAALCSSDLNTALGRIARYKRLVSPMALQVDVGDKSTTLELEWLDATAEPPVSLVATYFGVAVRRGPRPLTSFSPEDAALPFLTANEKMWQFFEPGLRKRLSELDALATTADRVQAALLELLPSGSASMDSVSRRLGSSTRTLQRRLREEGQSFQALLSKTREDLTKHYLKTSALTGTEISFLLGFEDPNSFFRAFHAWTGETPERARSAMREKR